MPFTDQDRLVLAHLDWAVSALVEGLYQANVKLDSLLKKETQLMATTQDILTAVAAEKTVTDSLVVFVQGLKDQLATAIANGASPADLQAILDGVNANAAAEAAIQNTPAAP